MKESLKAAFFLLLYGVIAVAFVYFVSQRGVYPDGADTMFYVFREDALYHSINDEGIFYQLWDPYWYNGVQISRYWAPLCTYVMAGCQAVCKGNPYNGYLLFVGLIYFVGAIVWLAIGYEHGRPYMGAFIGAIWGLIPHNLFQLFIEGVLVRSMILAWVPAYVVALYDYIHKDRKYSYIKIIIYMFLMVMTHMGYAGMVALATLMYLVVERIINRISYRKMLGTICAVVDSMLISGIWLLPSLIGKSSSIDSSSIMEGYFQPLFKDTVNPFRGIGTANYRWLKDKETAYFGLVLFVLCIVGILFARKKAKSGFTTAFITVLLTSPVAYPLLSRMPGGDMLWMLRFMSIAICFALVGLFYWDTIKKPFAVVMCVLLVIETIPSWEIITLDRSGVTAEERYDKILSDTCLGEARKMTRQRVTVAESIGTINPDQTYMLAGYEYGENNVQYCLGQGVWSAVTYRTIIQMNQALEDGHFRYYFDRCLELGNDTVVISTALFDPDSDEEKLEEMTEDAKALGYELVVEKGQQRVYHLDVEGNFGVITEYNAIGIGSGNANISLGFPCVKETEDANIEHYSLDELLQYKAVFLSGFTYDNKENAEEMIRRLSDNGTKVIIFADGIPTDRMTSSQSFLGVTCQQIVFNNGYPELTVGPGRFDPDLFPKGYTNWKTVYINGLDNVTGTFRDSGQIVPFLGTKYNDNVIFVGINLFFHYQLTNDETVGMVLAKAFGMDPKEIPKRKIVPLTIETSGSGINIVSEYDNVNTTLGFQDIFVSEQDIKEDGHLLVVDKGEYEIRFKYPYFWSGLIVSIVGILLMILAIKMVAVRRRRESMEEMI